MDMDKDYFAFISYQREDQKWAIWLRNQLEHYKIPTNVTKSAHIINSSLCPIFVDVNDLVAGNLSEMINDSLVKSKFLIVICSPKAAKSSWVNKEVETFIELGRTEFIIPFVVDGTPFSNYAEEVFPPALSSLLRSLPIEQEAISISVKERGREASVVTIASRMLGVNYDLLWSYHNKRKWLSPLRALSTPIRIVLKRFVTSNDTKVDEYTPHNDNTDIFISYRRVDGRDVARTIEQALLGAHYKNVFFDYTSIQDGKFNLKILDAIYSCKDFILVLSPMSMKRCSKKGDWVAREIRTALKYKSHIIPVVIENSKGNTIWNWPKNFPKDMSEIKDIEQLPFQMGTYFPDAMRNLINRLNTSKKGENKLIIQDDKDFVNLKIKCPVSCVIYIDDELFADHIEKNKLKKIPLKKGEYLIRIETDKNEVIYKERKLIIKEEKLLSNDDFDII